MKMYLCKYCNAGRLVEPCEIGICEGTKKPEFCAINGGKATWKQKKTKK